METKVLKEKLGLVHLVPMVSMLLVQLVMWVILDHLVAMVMMELKVTWDFQVSLIKVFFL